MTEQKIRIWFFFSERNCSSYASFSWSDWKTMISFREKKNLEYITYLYTELFLFYQKKTFLFYFLWWWINCGEWLNWNDITFDVSYITNHFFFFLLVVSLYSFCVLYSFNTFGRHFYTWVFGYFRRHLLYAAV